MILSKEKNLKIDISDLINGFCRNNQFEKFILVVPTNRRLRSLKKKLISENSAKAASGINLETLTTMFGKILGRKKSFISLNDALAMMFLKEAFSGCELNYFKTIKNNIPKGTIERIKNVLSEYKKHGVTPEMLLKESNLLNGSEKLKAEDISKIYEKYIWMCDSLSVFEPGDIYRNLLAFGLDDIKSEFRSFYPNAEYLFFDGFDEITAPERSLINKITSLEKLQVFINFDYAEGNPHLFGNLDECFNYFKMQGFNSISAVEKPDEDEFKSLLKSRLFNSSNTGSAVSKDNITFISALTAEEEIRLIASQIKELIINDKAEPGNICVAFNLIDEHSLMASSVFNSFGIPVNITDRPRIESANSVKTILQFLEIEENDYFFNSIMRALNNRLVSISLNPSDFRKISRHIKVISGYNNWITAVNEELEQYSIKESKSKINIKSAENCLTGMKELEALLNPFTKSQTLKEFFSNILVLIDKLNIQVNILKDMQKNTEADIKALNVFLETVSTVFNLIEKQNGEGKKYSFTFFMEHLRNAASWARYNVKEKSDYGVLITNFDEIRGLKFEYLFLGGLNDGELPTKYRPEVFLSGKYQRLEENHLRSEMYRFYRVLNCHTKHLYLSRAENKDETILSESILLADLKKIFEIQQKDSQAFKNKFFSKSDIAVYAGLMHSSEEAMPEYVKNFRESISLGKKITAEKQRISLSAQDNEYNGVIGDIPGMFNPEAVYSVSQLETYKACPFKYFMERIIKAELVEDPEEEPEAMEIGNLFHNILEETFTELKKKRITLSGCSDKVFDEAVEIMFSFAIKKIPKSIMENKLLCSQKERILGYDNKRETSALYKVLLEERKRTDGFIPSYFEASFGMKGKSDDGISKEEYFKIDKIKLRGTIDRIDINNEEGKFNILDYKTNGKTITGTEIISGKSLQLPVYLLAAEKMLQDKNQILTKWRVFIYSLKDSNKDFGQEEVQFALRRSKNYDPEIENKEFLPRIPEIVNEIVDNISAGMFRPQESDKTCRYCDFVNICRVKEIQKKVTVDNSEDAKSDEQ